ncbi:uncharacterized protein LOC128736038 [Sabethes cyaneus]|uniref:uncharacterized protein LOC128736038 n=1 Tax=Sabethes cyaneus TaxID=53552 RepID=UPI00237EC581|nr:uncharacterized protein LOC128736038 [Sabethes cyaneus]
MSSSSAPNGNGLSQFGTVEQNVKNVPSTAAKSLNGIPAAVIPVPTSVKTQVNVDVANKEPSRVSGKTSSLNAISQRNTCSANDVRRNPLREVRRVRDFQCQLCEERDNDEMVQCDSCDRWFHFVCVQVTEAVANVSWVCPNCANVERGQNSDHNQTGFRQRQNPPPNRPPSVQSKGKASSARSEARRLKELELNRLKEEFEMAKRFLDRKYEVLRRCGSEVSSVADVIEDNQSKVAEWLAETERHGEDADSGLAEKEVSGQTPNMSGTLKEHQALDAIHQNRNPSCLPTNQQGQRFQRDVQFQQELSMSRVPPSGLAMQHNRQLHEQPAGKPHKQSESILPEGYQGQSAQLQFHDRAAVDTRQTTHGPVPDLTRLRVNPAFVNTRDLIPDGQGCHAPHDAFYPQYSRLQIPHQSTFFPSMNARNEFAPNQRSTPIPSGQPRQRATTFATETAPIPTSLGHVRSRATAIAPDDTICILNRNQIAARQAVSKDLPEFDGTLEDWPLFYAMLTSSTQMCGFTNEENMLRLRKCLKGKALEAVRCELLHPTNVADVLSTLKMLYGRPEALIQSIIRKIRSLPPPNMEKLETVVNFSLSVKNMVATIRACEVDDYIFNASLRYELVERLPPSLKLDWARFSRGYVNANIAHFSAWLYTIAEDASAVMVTPCHDQRTRITKRDGFLNLHVESESSFTEDANPSAKMKADNSTDQCVVCKGSCLTVAKCSRFAELSYESKWATIKECKLCRKCLRKHNGSCKQQKQCGVNGCTFLHHPLLHKHESQNANLSSSKQVLPAISTGSETASCNVHQGQSAVLFRIIPVMLYGPEKVVRTYAFIDDGSELTLMEQSLADELGIKGPKKQLCLKWTGGTCKMENESQQVNLKISGLHSSTKFDLSGVYTISSLKIRPQTLMLTELQERFPYLSGLPLEGYNEVSPRLLIGLNYANLGHGSKSREGKRNEPIAMKTRLGWTVYGNCTKMEINGGELHHHSVQHCECNSQNDNDLHRAMKSYFALDSMGVIKSNILMSREDQRAQSLLESRTRQINKRYESGLLWKFDHVRLPDSKTMALRRWKCLEYRMHKDPRLAEALQMKIQDHVSKGYVRKLTSEELAVSRERVWYLPIFAVVNPNKPGKTRLVWDAAATAHGISLNSMLMKGPDQLTSLLSVLIRFREFKVAVCGDIREMFHQVHMRTDDQHCQRFLWKSAEDSEPSVYIVQVMTFGACCSPSIAQYVKNRNAKLFERDHPEAFDAITRQHYVDDMLVSMETVDEAVALAQQVKNIHMQAGFEMRNWISNSSSVLVRLKEGTAEEKDMNIGEEATTEKILGMWWNTSTDCFTYKLSSRYDEALLTGSRRPSKREVLRILMMVYDPIGFIAHLLMFLKTLLQEIWRTAVGWDDPIEDAQFAKWMIWLAVFPEMTKIKIPRCYRSVLSKKAEVEMHTFVDASESGFAAVVYFRFREGDVIECSFVAAKTRVAPLKFLSIPRSELQAAVLGVRLADTILTSLSINVRKRYFWSDSKDVLCWLKSDHRRYSPFVAFRVSEILESTDIDEWRWIPTKMNVADEGTKWARVPDLSENCRWFCGPQFLRQDENTWPGKPSLERTTAEELRPHLLVHTATVESPISPQNFSKWSSLLRCTALVFRFVNNLKRVRKERLSGPLTQRELAEAETYLFRLAQSEVYADEIATLAVNNAQKRTRINIIRHNPLFRDAFLDESGIVRVRGRISACEFIDRDAAEPVILPRNHHVTRLIINDLHERFNHQNHLTVVNQLLQRFRIPRLKATYQAVRKDCQYCKNSQAQPQPPMMAKLPQARLTAFSLPFTHMGVDYFGPIQVSVGRRSEKRWGVLATCMTTRAIYLQVAHTLTTDSCVMAIRNIMARRGVPAVIYSDRGTNFQATSKELRTAIKQLDHDRFAKEFNSPHTQWVFNPPLSPHMGGAWERLIRTVKKNLTILQSSRLPTDEVLQNALAEVENIVNSRPLTEIPIEDDSSPVLTPNDFLLGSSNGLRSWAPLDDSPVLLKNSYTQSQLMADRFWRQWVRDYLPSITRRTKWFTPAKPITVNDIVLIVDPKLPRNCWPKGRVIAAHQGNDGQVRRVTVQTASGGIYERPAVSIAVLDIGVV